MNSLLPIPTALCLPAPDIAALIQGRIIAAMPRIFIRPGQQFALYPVDLLPVPIAIDYYYCLNYLSVAKSININYQIQAWAKCELTQIIDESQYAEKLSKLTIWTEKALEKILHQQQHIFLSYLRVYELSQPYQLSLEIQSNKLGKFIGLLKPLAVSDTKPVLVDNIFATRKHHLEKLQPPPHPEIEELLDVLSPQTVNNSKAKLLESDIHLFFDWNYSLQTQQKISEFDWIKTISELGDRTQEQEKKKINYQAGTEFENISRKALEFIGFKVDQSYKGGAGGLDLYCSEPYPVVIECKCGKSIPNRTIEELLKLGGTHLGADKVLDSPKLIIAPNYAKPTSHTLKAAKQWKVSIIKAMSLQKLVELKAQYPGSINLIELKPYLEAGIIDDKIQEYIDKVNQEIKLRSHLIQLVRNYLHNSNMESITVEALHGVYFGSNPPQPLEKKEMHEILIELSSPLSGYLGRIKDTDWKTDKFYYLRDLFINTNSV